MYANKLKTLRDVLGICLAVLTVLSLIDLLFEICGRYLIPVHSSQMLSVLSVLLIIFILINKYVEE